MTLTRDDSVKFEMGIPKLVVVVHLVISRCCFARSSKEMNKDIERTSTAIVLLIVW